MSNIFCVTSINPVGCTFLDWSVYYLSGQENFYSIDKGWEKVVSNPLQSINAHGHPRNIVNGAKNTIDVINELKLIDSNLLSFYPCLLFFDEVAKKLNLDISNVSDPTVLSQIDHSVAEDFRNILNACYENNVPVIYVKQQHYPMYRMFIRTLERKMFEHVVPDSEDVVREEFLNAFFHAETNKEWGNLVKDLPIWDRREFIALNIRPYSTSNFDNKVNFSNRHYYIDSMDLWLNGETKVLDILDYLKLNIDNEKYQQWIPVYREWQKKQLKILNFCWNVDYICESIVNNHYLKIDTYNMDLWQEAIIQHILIYKYNLNLKNWQLEKFPSNTQDLHLLLEPNIHPTEILYK